MKTGQTTMNKVERKANKCLKFVVRGQFRFATKGPLDIFGNLVIVQAGTAVTALVGTTGR